jgi:molecular chaperone GrpE
MSEMENEQAVKINDRRRFDPAGELRPEVAGEEAAAPPADAQKTEELARAQAEAGALRTELEAARKRVDELARGLQSLMKDREEFKQRLTRERENMLEVERGEAAIAVLESIDELDRCLSASAADNSPLAQGVRLIRDGLLSKMQGKGIERIEVLGKIFDPNLAEAADMELTDSPDEDQKILAEVQAGYRMKGRIVRPARVKVAKYVKPAQA